MVDREQDRTDHRPSLVYRSRLYDRARDDEPFECIRRVGSDAAQRGPINPWHSIYYIVSGRDVTGELVNDGQQATRQEAIWMYTAANGWFSKEENDLGSIEVGKFGDLVVLNNDFFDEDEVSEEDIRDIASVLTIVGGRIVHDAGILD
ncbi:MAG: amidohydrolase family protein [Proteobacteria bacterium]|nr:amidohydrolase family protein [Pseudomonadota bacterium]